MKKLILLSVLLTRTCNISAVDYAVDEVQIVQKTKITIDGNPGVRLMIKNKGTLAATNIVITVKAKRGQNDIEVTRIEVTTLDAGEVVARTAVFGSLTTHMDYDLITYAVQFE